MTTVVIGAGHAGIQVADSLRAEGYKGKITVIDKDEAFPYQRPPLSKDYFKPGPAPEPLPLRSPSFFEDSDIHLLTGEVAKIERRLQRVRLVDQSVIPYEHLVLATGARPRELACVNDSLRNVYPLKTQQDAENLNAVLPASHRIVVVGAGFIGLEFAANAKQLGLDVTVLEFASRPMARAVSPEVSKWFADTHRKLGIQLRLEEGVAEINQDEHGWVSAVVSTTGAIYPADLVVVGIGVLPNEELAVAAELQTDNGIVVDEAMRTSDARILAVGDCANFLSSYTGSRTRLESVQNATDQARHAARTIMGDLQPYEVLPWFWSIQHTHRLQIAGIPRTEDVKVTVGNPERDKFSVLSFRGSKLVAVESVNSPADHSAARRLLATGTLLTTEKTEESGFSLSRFSKQELASVT